MDNDSNKLAGVTGLLNIKNSTVKKSAHIGTWFSVEFWGRGFNSEAKKLLIDFAFKKLKLERIVLQCKVDNIRSKKAIEKLGAIYEGTSRHELLKNNKWSDVYNYSILRSEWIKRNK